MGVFRVSFTYNWYHTKKIGCNKELIGDKYMTEWIGRATRDTRLTPIKVHLIHLSETGSLLKPLITDDVNYKKNLNQKRMNRRLL